MQLSRQVIRFIIVGISNTIIGYSIFLLSLYLLPPIAIRAALSQVICYIPALLWSYYWNSRWTFGGAMMSNQSFARFIMVQLSLFALSSLIIGLGVDYAGLPASPVWFVVMAFIIVLNFLATKFIVFRATGNGKAND